MFHYYKPTVLGYPHLWNSPTNASEIPSRHPFRWSKAQRANRRGAVAWTTCWLQLASRRYGEFKWGNSRNGVTGYPKMDGCHKWMIAWDSPIYGHPPKYGLVKQLNQRMANLRWSKFGDGNLWQRLHGFTETVENPTVSPKASSKTSFFPLPGWIFPMACFQMFPKSAHGRLHQGKAQ